MKFLNNSLYIALLFSLCFGSGGVCFSIGTNDKIGYISGTFFFSELPYPYGKVTAYSFQHCLDTSNTDGIYKSLQRRDCDSTRIFEAKIDRNGKYFLALEEGRYILSGTFIKIGSAYFPISDRYPNIVIDICGGDTLFADWRFNYEPHTYVSGTIVDKETGMSIYSSTDGANNPIIIFKEIGKDQKYINSFDFIYYVADTSGSYFTTLPAFKKYRIFVNPTTTRSNFLDHDNFTYGYSKRKSQKLIYSPSFWQDESDITQAQELFVDSPKENIDFKLSKKDNYQTSLYIYQHDQQKQIPHSLGSVVVAYNLFDVVSEKIRAYTTRVPPAALLNRIAPGSYVLLIIPDDPNLLAGFYAKEKGFVPSWEDAMQIPIEENIVPDSVVINSVLRRVDFTGRNIGGFVRGNDAGSDNDNCIAGVLISIVNDDNQVLYTAITDKYGRFFLPQVGCRLIASRVGYKTIAIDLCADTDQKEFSIILSQDKE